MHPSSAPIHGAVIGHTIPPIPLTDDERAHLAAALMSVPIGLEKVGASWKVVDGQLRLRAALSLREAVRFQDPMLGDVLLSRDDCGTVCATADRQPITLLGL